MLPFERLERLHVSNVWLFDGGAGGRWLLDCGHVAERPLVLSALKRRGLDPEGLNGILLTHRHSDHAGNAAFFQQAFGLPVWAHRRDAEILDGSVARPRMPFGKGDLLASALTVFENRLPARVSVVRRLEDGQQIAGLTVFFTPGHTEGSALFLHPESGSLVSGDTVLNAIPPMAQREGLSLPHPTFSTNWPQACASLVAFQKRGLAYQHLLSGHGPALMDAARQRVDELLRRSNLA